MAEFAVLNTLKIGCHCLLKCNIDFYSLWYSGHNFFKLYLIVISFDISVETVGSSCNIITFNFSRFSENICNGN